MTSGTSSVRRPPPKPGRKRDEGGPVVSSASEQSTVRVHDDEQRSQRLQPPSPQEGPLTPDQIRVLVREAVLDATAPILQSLRAIEHELRVVKNAAGPVHRPASVRLPTADGNFSPAIVDAAAFGRSGARYDLEDAELARAFSGSRRRKQMGWMLALFAVLAVGAAIVGAIVSNPR